MKATTWEESIARLLQATASDSEAALAARLGLTSQSIYNAKKKGKIPPSWVFQISQTFNVSSDWLFFGRGPMHPNDLKETAHTTAKQDHIDNPEAQTAPIIGLAACGISGWYNPGPIALRAPIPGNYVSKGKLFAVIAIGCSMQPEGIRQGYVVFCDPDIVPVKDDAVFIERTNGTASIKKYIKKDFQWIYLEGWLDPNSLGEQKSYNERVALEAVKRIAPVVIVQRKP